jgi:hypothetical protein
MADHIPHPAAVASGVICKRAGSANNRLLPRFMELTDPVCHAQTMAK